jgi:hypothetical protein
MYEPPSERWKPFGSHMHRFEPPDLYHTRMDGEVSEDDVRTQFEAIRTLSKHAGHTIFWMSDVRKMGSFTTEARRAVAEETRKDALAGIRASAAFGASFPTRVVVTLLLRAIRALKPAKARPYAFVDTEAEARAFLDEQRKRGAE